MQSGSGKVTIKISEKEVDKENGFSLF